MDAWDRIFFRLRILARKNVLGKKNDVKGTFGWIPLSFLSGRDIHRITVGSGLSILWPVANSRSFRRKSPCVLPSPPSFFLSASMREGQDPRIKGRSVLEGKGGLQF